MAPRSMTVDIGSGYLDVLVWEPAGAARPTGAQGAVATVVALHGFPETSWEWEPVAGILAGEGIRVVAPSQRGYSPGARPGDVADYAIEHLSSDVLTVADHFGLERIHVLGHDWGASVAWWLAAHHPGRVATLTAVSVPHLGAFSDAVATDPDQQRRSAYFGLYREEGRAEDVLLEGEGRRLREMFGDEVPTELVDRHLAVLGDREGLTGALNWYRAMRRYDLPDVAVPTTFIWGEEDTAIARSGAEATAARMAGDYHFVPVAGAGHWLPERFPALVAGETLARVSRAQDRPGGPGS